MSAVWELRIFGTDRRGSMRRKVYTFVIQEGRGPDGVGGYERASAEAKRLAKLDGLAEPRVYAATRLREVPDEPRPGYLTSSASAGGPWGVR